MGCIPSKPCREHPPQVSNPAVKPYKGPSEFRASVMRTTYKPYRAPKDVHTSVSARPDRQAAQMYQTYRAQDQQRSVEEGRRYSWEGHPSEKVFLTFERMAEKGVISKHALKRK